MIRISRYELSLKIKQTLSPNLEFKTRILREEYDEHGHVRVRRQATGELYMDLRQTRCPLLLVADYRFFSEMGGGSSKGGTIHM